MFEDLLPEHFPLCNRVHQKVNKIRDELKFLDGISHIYHFQHLCSHLKIKLGMGVVLLYFLGQKDFEKKIEFFVEFDSI